MSGVCKRLEFTARHGTIYGGRPQPCVFLSSRGGGGFWGVSAFGLS
jgi:hypothetical protein